MKKQINLSLLLISIIGSVYFYPKLPEQIPMHWNVMGEIDSYWNKDQAVWFIPALMFIMMIGFRYLPLFDPNREKYKLFNSSWNIIQTGLLGFFVYLQYIIFYISLNPGINMMPFMFIGLGILFILIGNYLSKIRQNYFIGIKIPWTLSSEDNWNKTHRFASWCFVFAGTAALVESIFLWYAPGVILGSILLATMLPMIYSYLLFKKRVYQLKYIILILVVLIGIIVSIRLFGNEDDWICNNGVWIKHGQPSTPKPTSVCN